MEEVTQEKSRAGSSSGMDYGGCGRTVPDVGACLPSQVQRSVTRIRYKAAQCSQELDRTYRDALFHRISLDTTSV